MPKYTEDNQTTDSIQLFMSPIPGINCQEKRLVMAHSVTVVVWQRQITDWEVITVTTFGFRGKNFTYKRQTLMSRTFQLLPSCPQGRMMVFKTL